jgi:hypothetical protein
MTFFSHQSLPCCPHNRLDLASTPSHKPLTNDWWEMGNKNFSQWETHKRKKFTTKDLCINGIILSDFFCVVLGLELRAFTLSHSTSPFYEGFFKIGSCELFAWGWLQTVILLTSASQVARIAGMSHWLLALLSVFDHNILWILYIELLTIWQLLIYR